MPKKKSKKKSSPKKDSDKSSSKDMSGFWRGIGALLLIVGGIVLAFGAFINAPIPHDFWHGAWWTLGGAAIVAPLALIYLGALKFITEDQRVPLAKIIGVAGMLVFLAGWLNTGFSHLDDTSTWVGGHGGQVGQSIGNALANAFGKFLSSLVFFVLFLGMALFTFGIEPKALLKLAELFKKGDKEESDDEDLAALKSKMSPGFQLNEGVPVEHHRGSPGATLRNTAAKLSPT